MTWDQHLRASGDEMTPEELRRRAALGSDGRLESILRELGRSRAQGNLPDARRVQLIDTARHYAPRATEATILAVADEMSRGAK